MATSHPYKYEVWNKCVLQNFIPIAENHFSHRGLKVSQIRTNNAVHQQVLFRKRNCSSVDGSYNLSQNGVGKKTVHDEREGSGSSQLVWFPARFWSEIVKTAEFLVNRYPADLLKRNMDMHLHNLYSIHLMYNVMFWFLRQSVHRRCLPFLLMLSLSAIIQLTTRTDVMFPILKIWSSQTMWNSTIISSHVWNRQLSWTKTALKVHHPILSLARLLTVPIFQVLLSPEVLASMVRALLPSLMKQ